MIYRKYTKYGNGGTPDLQGQVNGYASDARFVSSILQNIAPDSNIGDYGGGALSGAATGAQIGSTFGPAGTAIGGAVGLVGGIFGAYKKKQAEMNARRLQQMNLSIANRQRQDASDKAILSGYNTNGNSTVTGYYAYGGYLKVLKPIKFLKSPLKKMPDGGVLGGSPKKKIPLAPVTIDSQTGLPIANNGQVDLGYSRVYGSQHNIPNNNIEALKAQYRNDSSVMSILNRNIAPQGEIPMYGADDGDAIKQLLDIYQKPQQVANNGVPHLAEGGSIHIKPSHRGRFTAYKARTGKTTEEALHSSDSHVRKMAQFAKNASQWKHADGGELPPTSTLTGQGSTTQLASDTHLYNGPSHADGGIPIDTTGNGEPNAEVEGNEVQKGNQIYSDRLTISPMLELQLKMAKVKLQGKPTYADVATKLGKLKGKFENKLGSYSPVINRTGKKMVNRYDDLLQETFVDQEQSKIMMRPQMAFGGTLPIYAGGGNIDDPRDGYQQKIDAINKQIADSDAKYEQLKSQGKQTYALEQMNRYRQQVKQRLQQSLGNYKGAVNNYANLAKNYNPDNTFTNFLSKIHLIGGNMDSAKGEIAKHDKSISDYSEILNRLDPSKVNASKGDWRKQVDVPWSIDDPFDSNVKSTTSTTPRINTPIVSKSPMLLVNTSTSTTLTPPSHISSPVAKSSNGRYKAISYNSHITPLKAVSTSAIQPEVINGTLPNITIGNIAIPTAPLNAVVASDSPGFMSRVGDAINDYGADALNVASYIGNEARIGKMQAPIFKYNPAPNYNYIDRSGLAKNENAVATRNMMKSVVNTSAQGQQAQKAGIFAQNLESNNQINNNENQRYDAYNNNYDNRALQVDIGNTDIANREADVTTQVGNDKIALGIQNQNAFNQGEIQNQATRAQQALDNTKTGFILAASQDPSKLVQLLSSTTDPILRRKIQLMMRGTN